MQLGFIGLGQMGRPMVERLKGAGHSLKVYNRTRSSPDIAAKADDAAAGEVVEEMQYLRELLIRFLAPSIAALRPRQGMALLLRLNRLVDRGVAMAVVGYTDELAASLLASRPRGSRRTVREGTDRVSWPARLRGRSGRAMLRS